MLWPIIFAALALPYVEVSARACSCRAHIRKASRKRWQSNASKRLKPVREMGLEPMSMFGAFMKTQLLSQFYIEYD